MWTDNEWKDVKRLRNLDRNTYNHEYLRFLNKTKERLNKINADLNFNGDIYTYEEKSMEQHNRAVEMIMEEKALLLTRLMLNLIIKRGAIWTK